MLYLILDSTTSLIRMFSGEINTCFLLFEKGFKKWSSVIKMNPYPVTYYWKNMLTSKPTKLSKCVYNISGQNGDLLILTGCHFG